MSKPLKDCLLLTLITLGLTLAVWLPHILAVPNFWGLNFQTGFSTIYRNFDGLEYVVIAKSFYNAKIIDSIPGMLSASYYASHFPGYAFLISIFSPLAGYLKSMLFVSLLSTILASWAFYFLVRNFRLSEHPLFLSIVFLTLPARWLIVHSVGSSEPAFILFTICAVYSFLKFEKSGYFSALILTGIFGLMAQITRPQGILLFAALSLYVIIRKAKVNYFKYFPLALIPLGLIAIFYLFSQTYGDFWAYFHSGDNIHLTFPPFQVFNKNQFWVGDMWLEDIVYIFLLGFLGGAMLLKQKLFAMAFFVLTYLAAAALVAHRDISRYILPIAPFVIIAFEKTLTSREFKIIFPIILLAIYLYAQNFILNNAAPIPNISLFN